jgi:hypothetical protein
MNDEEYLVLDDPRTFANAALRRIHSRLRCSIARDGYSCQQMRPSRGY